MQNTSDIVDLSDNIKPVRVCSVPGCRGSYKAKGYCQAHYKRVLAGRPLDWQPIKRRICSVPGCPRDHRARGYCNLHYDRWRNGYNLLARHRGISSVWTPERVEMLNRLFEEGLPTSEIGRHMGLTKNTIIGKLYRSGMTRGVTWKVVEPTANPFPAVGTCLWPVGHPSDPTFHFCGGDVDTRGPYCASHNKIAFLKKPLAEAA